MFEDYKAIAHMLFSLSYEAETYGIQLNNMEYDDLTEARKAEEVRIALDRLEEKLTAIEKYWEIA